MFLNDILKEDILSIGNFHITVEALVIAVIIIAFTRLSVWLVNWLFLNRFFRKRNLDQGRSYAVGQIVKYFIYIVGFVILVRHLFGSVSFLTLGSAGLFVGIGLALQQTFTDVISGIILLLDRSAEVGDIIVIEGTVGQVKKIGLRTSEIYTRDRVSVLLPNSKLISNDFTNWSHNQEPARFYIEVGVAYKSDAEHVENILLDCLKDVPEILSKPPASVQLVNFGDSSIDFKLFYFSEEFFFAERVKSDLRKKIFKRFNQEGIEIPFPQRDFWFKNQNG